MSAAQRGKGPPMAPAGKGAWKSKDGRIELVSTEMLFCDATDLGTDLLAAVGPAVAAMFASRARVGTPGTTREAQLLLQGEAVQMMAREVVAGRLTSYLSRILATTTMIVRGEGAGTFNLRDRGELDAAFTGRQQYAMPAVKLALEVSLRGFLDGLTLIGIKMPTMMTEDQSPSEDSVQSMSATG